MAGKTTKGGKSGVAGAAAEKRGGGLRPVAGLVAKVTGRAFGRRGLAQAGLAAEWEAIVGAELAAVCRPQKLVFPRRGERLEGILTLRVAAGHATVLQHLEPHIVERVNGFFGYRAVARLKFQQGPLAPRRAAGRPTAPPLPAKSEAALAERLAPVEDEALRGALTSLGRAVLEQARRDEES